MSELFRREAVHHATRRLEGAVILATPVSVKTVGVFLASSSLPLRHSPPWRPTRARRRSSAIWCPTKA